MEYKIKLRRMAEGNEKFVAFATPIIKSKKKLLGVRTPDFVRLAKEMAKDMGVQDAKKMAREVDDGVYEEVSLFGAIIGYGDFSDRERIELFSSYIPKVDCWALVDGMLSKQNKYDGEVWWEFAGKCLKSMDEFEVRFGVMLMMSQFLSKRLKRVFERLRGVKHEGYYVKMVMAWTYAEAALVDYGATMKELEDSGIDVWTKRKAYTKMCESRRLSASQKEEIREARAKLRKG